MFFQRKGLQLINGEISILKLSLRACDTSDIRKFY